VKNIFTYIYIDIYILSSIFALHFFISFPAPSTFNKEMSTAF